VLSVSELQQSLVELQNVRERVTEESNYFEDASVSDDEKSTRLLFLFIKDLMDGINGEWSRGRCIIR
jgi:hypothetical protein